MCDRTAARRRPARKENMDWPGRPCRTRPIMSVFANAIGKWSDLADAAGTPRQTARPTPAATATASATTAASATAAATAATPGYLHAALGRCSIFLIENIERGQ